MASKFGTINCATTAGGNIAHPQCDLVPGRHIGSIFVRNGDKFLSADLASSSAFKSALIGKLHKDSPADRAYIVGRYKDWSFVGEAASDQTFGDGTKVQLKDSTVAYEMPMIDGLYYFRSVKKTIHGKASTFDEILIFDQGDGTFIAYGANRESTTPGIYDMGGFGLDNLTVSTYSRRTGSAVGQFTVKIGYSDAIDLDTNFFLMGLDFNPLTEVDGLIEADISATSTSPTNVTVRGAVPGSGSLTDVYGADLAVAGAWVVTNRESTSANNGNGITVSSVTRSGDTYVLTIAATGTDPDNPGAGKQVGVKLAAVSVLEGLVTPVLALESNEAYTALHA